MKIITCKQKFLSEESFDTNLLSRVVMFFFNLQVINFIESTLNDLFVYKAGAFADFFLT